MNCKSIVSKCLIENQGAFRIALVELKCVDGRVSEIKEVSYADNSCKGVLIPAFFNMHSHLGESTFRNINGTDWTISKYLEYTERYNESLSKEQKASSWIESANFSAKEMRCKGTIGFCAARSVEIANTFDMLTLSGYPIMNSKKLASYKNAGINGFKEYWSKNKSDRNKIGVFLHSVYANDIESFELAQECIDIGAEFITVHISEDEETTKFEKSVHGMSAIELLDKYGLLTEKTILVHGGCCSENELSIVKKRGSVISVCPISNSFLNTKMIDLDMLEKMGIPWCISTDGLGTGRTFSLIEQAKVAKDLYSGISAKKYWESITRVPGRFFNNPLYTGNIEVGVQSIFLRTEYDGNDANELIENIMRGKIGYKTIEV